MEIELKLYKLKNRLLSFSAIFLLATSISAQSKSTSFVLNQEMAEISGLLVWGDSVLFAINDGGSGPSIYQLNFQGEIKRKWLVTHAENHDWEALAMDENYLYIGDFGNNSNQRKNLCVYKISLNSMVYQQEVSAEKIEFAFANQNAFPPKRNQRKFDAEAMTFYNDSLWIFSKNRVFFHPFTNVYVLPTKAGKYALDKRATVKTGRGHWLLNAVTGADSFGDTMLLTGYKKIWQVGLEDTTFVKLRSKHFFFIRQREAIAISHEGLVFVANEKNKIIGRMKLHRFRFKHA